MSLRIDRASFLSLTFGMAGLACNSGPPPTVAANVVDIPLQPPPPADAGGAAVAAPNDVSSKPLAVAEPADDDVIDGPVSEGGAITLSPVDQAGCGWVDPKTVTRPAAACKDDEGTAGSCNVMKGCATFPFPRQQCESYRKTFKAKVAQRALDCLGKLTNKQVCDDACNTYRCGDRALKTACPDPSADASCTQIVAKCRSVSMNDCRTYLSGLNPTGRAKMVTCLTSKAGCGFGLFSCSESL
jgi:hypothetical protein